MRAGRPAAAFRATEGRRLSSSGVIAHCGGRGLVSWACSGKLQCVLAVSRRENGLKKLNDLAPRRHREDIGASPTSIFVPPSARPTVVRTWLYDEEGVQCRDGFVADPGLGKRRWIDIRGLADKDAIVAVASALGLGDLGTAEMFHTDQRPHSEVLGDLVQTFLRVPVSALPFRSQQVTLVLGPGYVLSLREGEGDIFDPVRKRLEAGSGRIRGPCGYLLFALIDTAIDLWFPMLESYGDHMDALEEQILADPEDGLVTEVHRLKRDLLEMRRALWPLREAIGVLLREDTPGIEDWMLPFFRDCADHAFEALDMVEVYREVAQGLVDLHLSSLSNRMNEIMKVLAIISTIFIPMTFIAGLYGMNFERASPWNMPELGWRFGYEWALALMAVSAAAMIWVFYRLGWIGRRRRGKMPPDGDEPRR
ncbi:MAG: magnesium and cobalt transport protein CorA [Alphaproteobacteria bacterium]|nr:MAG: magnesium and cobalt transport protein CorA [Alphaproteobacteria bacterium]